MSGQAHTAAFIGRVRAMWDEGVLTAAEIGERFGKSENAILHMRKYHRFKARQQIARRVRVGRVVYPSLVAAAQAHDISDVAARNRCNKRLWGWSFVDER